MSQPSLSINQLLEIFSSSGAAMAIYTGDGIIIEAITDAMVEVWGKNRSVVGKPLEEAVPELKGQPFKQQLQQVWRTGETFTGVGEPADLIIDGQLQTFFYDYEYRAIKDANGQVYAILHTSADVTERELSRRALIAAAELKAAQELALLESEERLLFTLNAAEIGTWDLDVRNDVITWDSRCRELYGFFRDDDIDYADILRYMHPDDRNKVDRAVRYALDPFSGGAYDIRFRTIGAQDGRLRWLHCKGKAYFDEQGVPYRFSGTAQDITGDVVARRREQQLLGLVSNNSEHMSIADMDGQIIYMNHAGRELLGIGENEDITTLGARDFYSDDELQRVQGEVIPELVKMNRWEGLIEMRNKLTGEMVPCEVKYVLIRDPDTGEPIGRGANARDLRPELRTRQELQLAIRELEFLADSIPAIVWTSTPDGHVDYVNRRWHDLHPDNNELPLGQAWVNNLHPDDVRRVQDAWAHSIRTGHPYGVEFRVLEAGDYRWYLVQAVPLRDAQGTVMKWYGTNTDIQAQKEAQAQKDNFLGVASHELKTPVTSIKAYAQMMERMFRNKGDLKNAELVNKMDRQINRLNSLIGDLLDVTKINTGRMVFSETEFDFDGLVDEISGEIQRTTEKHQIERELTVGKTITGDRDRLGQVITNLLTNAIKYSPGSERIIVSTKITDNELRLCVQDFGIGINPEKQQKVFEQFYRVSGSREHTFPGLGLGLYISAEIVRRMGGRIWVNSAEGEGSKFCFSLPIN